MPSLVPTGNPAADTLLRAIVAAFEQRFPGRVQGYYLLGSYAEGAVVPLSDLDCCAIFAGDWADAAEQAAAAQLAAQLGAERELRLDLVVWSAATLPALHPVLQVTLKLGSTLLYGVDLRDTLALPPLKQYATEMAAGARFFMARLRGLDELARTITYPDAADPFFGYTHKRIAAWYPPEIPAGTKELVAAVSRIASARVAAETGRYVPGKHAAITLYAAHIADTWSPLVTLIFARCKRDWCYLVPAGAAERAELRALCQSMLAFERDFLSRYPA